MTARYRSQLSSRTIDAHNRQRDFSEYFWTRLLDRLTRLLPRAATVVDAGVGSGVVATKIASRGFTVVGFDINPSMLAALAQRADRSVHYAFADVVELPVSAASVDAVMITNVLHLVADWRGPLAEAARILRPGGRLLVALGGGGRSATASEVNAYFRALVPVAQEEIVGPQTLDEYHDAVTSLGFRALEPIVETETVVRTIASTIDRLRYNVFTWPPNTPSEVLETAALQTTQWAVTRFGGLDASYEIEVDLTLHVATRP